MCLFAGASVRGKLLFRAKTVNCARRKMYGWVFGQGFNSPRLHQMDITRTPTFSKAALP